MAVTLGDQSFGAGLLLAADGGVDAGGSISGDVLSSAALNAIAAAAIARWAAAGATSQQLASLANITFTISDLPGGALGHYDRGQIAIDNDGAGHGWFIDRTPGDSFEFVPSHSGAAFAAAHMDLLTVIAHEFGHAMGLYHSDAGDVMSEALDTGVRRTPDADDLTHSAATPGFQTHFRPQASGAVPRSAHGLPDGAEVDAPAQVDHQVMSTLIF